MIDFETLQALSGGKAEADVACPLCSSGCKTAAGRVRKVLRVWAKDYDFITYTCARCGERGYAHADRTSSSSKSTAYTITEMLAAFRPQAPKPQAAPVEDKSDTARLLWRRSVPARGTLVETYLRSRGCWLDTEALRFLPARGGYPPAMIAAFGVTTDTITGIHLTRLLPDGSDRERGDKAKIMVGPSKGQPIVLRPANDLGGLLVAEGIETALAGAASGLGLWAAGSAGRLPDLADKIPAYVQAVTIIADVDDSGAGLKFSNRLGQLLLKRGLDVFLETGGRHG